MSHIHICLVSAQPIPNLTTVFQFKPDKVILLYTNEMERQVDWLESVIKGRRFDTEKIKTSAYDLTDIMSKCCKCIKSYPSDYVSLNITGGTKIQTIGAFQEFFSSGKDIFYVDTHDNKILKISQTEDSLPIEVFISVDEYLSSYGFKITNYVKDDTYILKRKNVTNYLANLAINKDWLLGKINSSFPDDYEKRSLPLKISFNNKELREMLTMLDNSGIAKTVDDKTVLIDDIGTAKYLRGFWFEEYVYIKAKQVAKDCDVRLNVTGEWDVKPGEGPKNEFDIVISKGNRLFLISCKTSYPDRKKGEEDEGVGRDYIYEILALGDRALGLFGKKMLVSARSIKDDKIKKRAALTGVKLIDVKNISTLKEILKQWLNS